MRIQRLILKINFVVECRYDSVIGTVDEHDATSERIIEKHPVFGDGFGLLEEPKVGSSFKYFSNRKIGPEVSTVFDTLVYVAAALFNVPKFTVQLMLGVGILVRNTFEHLVDYAIASKLSQVLSVNRMAFLCRLTEEAIFEDSEPRTDEDKLNRKNEAFKNFQQFIRPLIQWLVGREEFDKGTKFIFEGLQDPVINKHVRTHIVL